jgi:hypothetical protein
MILDHKSVRKCVCDFAATLTRSNINLEFVYLCIKSKDFAPISTISDYIHWAALAVWFFVFFITVMKSGMLEVLLHTYFLQYIDTTTHGIKDLNLFWMYLCIVFIAVICIPIKSHQSNQICSKISEALSVVSIHLILFLSVTCKTCICIIYLG